jgi:hypothetical protein
MRGIIQCLVLALYEAYEWLRNVAPVNAKGLFIFAGVNMGKQTFEILDNR